MALKFLPSPPGLSDLLRLLPGPMPGKRHWQKPCLVEVALQGEACARLSELCRACWLQRVCGPPQTSSLTFNEQGKVVGHTMGYVMDRRIGNTGGLGGAFGLMYGIGIPLPVPEGRPLAPSWQLQLFNSGNSLVQAGLLLVDRTMAALLPSWLWTKHARNNM